MKIVDRKTFLAMPSDTLFCKYAPCYVEELTIKGETLTGSNDFLYQDIALAIDAKGSDELFASLHESQETGRSLSMNFDVQSRDGCFDEDQLFAVYERQDVEALIERLKRCAAGEVGINGLTEAETSATASVFGLK